MAREAAAAAAEIATIAPQAAEFHDSPLTIFGAHEAATVAQMRNCMGVGNVVAGVICADGHLGYAQPVGGVIAYEKQISISGVGFDIGCGNMAVRLDTPFAAIEDKIGAIIKDVARVISFGIGRSNEERVEHQLFDDGEAWKESDMEAYRQKAVAQLGTVGSGNHYVDLLRDEAGLVWIGVHFGSRGLGHTSATRYLKAAGGKDGMHVPPAVIDEDSELGRRYIAAMELAGRYSYAGREWVVERVRKILGGSVTDMVHNHHNYAWRETHDGRDLWVVRKGATPAFPGQRGFVGGSMGDDAVIIEGVDSPQARASLYSTVHGAGRLFGRKEAKRRFTKAEMDAWLQQRGVTLVGADLDESPMAYRRLPEVLAQHAGTIRVQHTLRPFAVAMAGAGEFDPFKD
jgi:tRNA-splicing ligase RtcB